MRLTSMIMLDYLEDMYFLAVNTCIIHQDCFVRLLPVVTLDLD